jgi:putative peptidoglycan lipid II flippase
LLWLAAMWAPAPTAGADGLAQAALLALLISGGIAIYGLLLAFLGVTNWGDAVAAIRQTAPGDLRD